MRDQNLLNKLGIHIAIERSPLLYHFLFFLRVVHNIAIEGERKICGFVCANDITRLSQLLTIAAGCGIACVAQCRRSFHRGTMKIWLKHILNQAVSFHDTDNIASCSISLRFAMLPGHAGTQFTTVLNTSRNANRIGHDISPLSV